jgi:hypothetical protein
MRLLAVPILIVAVAALPACKRPEAHTDPRVNPESQSGFYVTLTYINAMPGISALVRELTACSRLSRSVIGRSLP